MWRVYQTSQLAGSLYFCYSMPIMAKYLVTGGAGYIGSHVTHLLLDQGHSVVVFDDLSTGNRENVDERAEFIEGSILDRDALEAAMQEVDGVLHFAAKLIVSESVEKPYDYYETNVVGTAAVLDAMRAAGTKKIVFASTAVVYDEHAPQPLVEDAPKKQTSPYGWSKWTCEQMIESRAHHDGFTYVNLRYFNVAGKEAWYNADYSHETHLIPLIIEVAQGKREVLQVFGTDYDTRDGSAVRDYIHVADVAAAHLAAIEQTASGAFNLGTNHGITVLEMVAAAEKALGTPIPTALVDRRAGDPPVLVAATEKARTVLGWEPVKRVEEAIQDSCA